MRLDMLIELWVVIVEERKSVKNYQEVGRFILVKMFENAFSIFIVRGEEGAVLADDFVLEHLKDE
jgi:hypothetical protein